MRLFAPVCSQTTSLQRCCSNFCFGQRSSRSPTRSKSTACKGCCGISAPSEQWVRLLQPLLPHSKGRWRAKTYSRSQMSEPLTYAPVILLTIKQFLVHICSEDWFLTQKLTFVAQSLRAPGVGHQLAQESLVAQTAGCLSGNDFRLCPNAGMDYAGTIPDNPAIGGISQTGDDPPPEGFQKLLGFMAATASAIPLGLLHMRPLQIWLNARVPSTPGVWDGFLSGSTTAVSELWPPGRPLTCFRQERG